MGISRRVLLRRIGAAAAGAAAIPALAEASTRPSGPIRQDRNENPYGPSPAAIAAMQDAVRTASNRYPDADAQALREAIARRHRVSPEQIVLGCGSGEILRMAAVAFLGARKTLVAARPSFELMSECARRVGAEAVVVPLTREYAHDLTAMLARCDSSTGLVYICNPNNPTGTLTNRRDLERFIRELPGGATVLIDEAYHHYVGESPDYASFVDRPVNDGRVIVARTFSTIFGLAGLRVGYAVTSPETARLLAASGLAENVNVVAARAAMAAIDDAGHLRLSVIQNTDDRQEFINQCHARMLKPIDSVTNFLMMNAGTPAVQVVEHFRKSNVLIAPPIPGFDTSIRVSLGTQAEMAEFWRVWDLMPAASPSGHSIR
jgi:histidinol-phosphate aminotransferase